MGVSSTEGLPETASESGEESQHMEYQDTVSCFENLSKSELRILSRISLGGKQMKSAHKFRRRSSNQTQKGAELPVGVPGVERVTMLPAIIIHLADASHGHIFLR